MQNKKEKSIFFAVLLFLGVSEAFCMLQKHDTSGVTPICINDSKLMLYDPSFVKLKKCEYNCRELNEIGQGRESVSHHFDVYDFFKKKANVDIESRWKDIFSEVSVEDIQNYNLPEGLSHKIDAVGYIAKTSRIDDADDALDSLIFDCIKRESCKNIKGMMDRAKKEDLTLVLSMRQGIDDGDFSYLEYTDVDPSSEGIINAIKKFVGEKFSKKYIEERIAYIKKVAKKNVYEANELFEELCALPDMAFYMRMHVPYKNAKDRDVFFIECYPNYEEDNVEEVNCYTDNKKKIDISQDKTKRYIRNMFSKVNAVYEPLLHNATFSVDCEKKRFALAHVYPIIPESNGMHDLTEEENVQECVDSSQENINNVDVAVPNMMYVIWDVIRQKTDGKVSPKGKNELFLKTSMGHDNYEKYKSSYKSGGMDLDLSSRGDWKIFFFDKQDKNEIKKTIVEAGFSKDLVDQIDSVPSNTRLFVSRFKVFLDWAVPGDKKKIARRGVEYPTVRMQDFSRDTNKYTVNKFKCYKTKEQAIVELDTSSGDKVYLAVGNKRADKKPANNIELLEQIAQLKKSRWELFPCEEVTFPMIDFTTNLGPTYFGQLDGNPIKGIMEIDFKMNHQGASKRRGDFVVAMGPVKAMIFTYRPFLLWIERDGLSDPLFALYADEKYWKEPSFD